jgi:hypothetical protein
MHKNINKLNSRYKISPLAKISPLIVALGSLLWRFISWASNVDFLFSIREGTFSTAMQFFSSQGWWIAFIGSVLWFALLAGKVMKPRSRTIQVEIILAASFVSFLFGVLMTVKNTSSSPNVFREWGREDSGCIATTMTARLRNFSAKYQMALICVFLDPDIDRYKNTVIAKSSLFEIEDTEILAPFSGQIAYRATQPGYLYQALALLPRNTSMDEIKCLDDVLKHGGKLLINEGPD